MSSNSVHDLIAGLILASGMSRRFGSENKLLAKLRGESVIARTVRAYIEADLEPVIVVVGYQSDAVMAELSGLPVETVLNPRYEEGQSRALVAGVSAFSPTTEAAIIGVGDQPLLNGVAVRRMADTYRSTGARLVVARYAGRRGNPVLFDRSLFDELVQVTGDSGGRQVLERHHAEISWVDFADANWALDVDSMLDLEAIEKQTADGT